MKLAFLKKEFLEQFRTGRGLILLAVFFLFGMMSPLLAKLMPELLGSMDMQGIKLVLPEPTAMDAYTQFFKNFTQMGIPILLLVFGGTLSNELSRGTLIILLAKGLPRHNLVLSKYMTAVALWSLGYVMAAGVTIGYTSFLFPGALVSHLFSAFFCLWLFGCMVPALILLSSTIASGSFGGLILTAVVLIIMLLLGGFPSVSRFNPISLASENMNLINGTADTVTMVLPGVISVLFTFVSLTVAIIVFNRKSL